MYHDLPRYFNMKVQFVIPFPQQKSKEQFYTDVEIVGKWDFWFMGKSEG